MAATPRAAVKLAGVVTLTAWWYVAWLATRATRVVSPELAARSHHGVVRRWARAMLRVLGVRTEVRGRPPAPPFFLACNHVSYVDILVLFAEVDGYFLAKSEIARWPVIGFIVRTTGTLFVERARKSDLVRVNRDVTRVLERGSGVIVFPEGTSSRGVDVLPFRPSVFDVPVKLGRTVANASLTYATEPPAAPADLAVCWWGDMKFLPHFLALLTLPSIRAGLTFGAEIQAGGDRKDLARRSRAAVARTFVPVAPGAPAGESGSTNPLAPSGRSDPGEPRTSTV
jgi:1-acyl-sn-glycerol-3-phosphate acyltransferase